MCQCDGKCPNCPERSNPLSRDLRTIPLKLPTPLCEAKSADHCRLGYSFMFRAIAVQGDACRGCEYLYPKR